MKRIFYFNIIFLVLIGCGFTPMYKDIKNLKFSVNINKITGDRYINNKIKSELSSYSLEVKDKNYDINIKSDYLKNIVAKDTTGAATEYKLIINVQFDISSANVKKTLTFNEKFNMQSISDKLEEQDYEESIKESLTNTIVRKLILQLSQLK
tara:strand:+ start:715 stop:1170 length:456 start_codon:yes stop_codon:yes gene_type:complete